MSNNDNHADASTTEPVVLCLGGVLVSVTTDGESVSVNVTAGDKPVSHTTIGLDGVKVSLLKPDGSLRFTLMEDAAGFGLGAFGDDGELIEASRLEIEQTELPPGASDSPAELN